MLTRKNPGDQKTGDRGKKPGPLGPKIRGTTREPGKFPEGPHNTRVPKRAKKGRVKESNPKPRNLGKPGPEP